MPVILVVDDDESVREMVADFLRELPSLSVQTAPSGEKALERAHERDFDLFLTDGQMPSMTGIELLKHLKKECNDAPVVVMSGDAMMRHRAILGGADGVLPKPFQREELVGLVKTLLFGSMISK